MEIATESSMISAEQKTSVDLPVHQNVSGLMQPDGDHTENGQLGGELTEQDKLDCSESSSVSEFDLAHSESFSISSDRVHSIENNERSEYSTESNISDQTLTEEHEPDEFTLFQAMPDLCMYYEQADTEIQELVLSDLEPLYEQETESEQPSEEDGSGGDDEGSEEISVSDSYEQYSEQDPNAGFDLDKEPRGSFEQCELNNQNMPRECHTTHFKSPELCQASKESMPAGFSGSLEQQPPAGQIENTYDCELTAKNSHGSCTDLFESSDDFPEENQSFEYYTEQDCRQQSLNELERAEQCSSCGKCFLKREIPEQREPSEPAQNSEDSEQSESFENSPELCEAFGTQRSVFHTSELPEENPPVERNTDEVRKRAESDMMFMGSMETFEARWLSQFLAVDGHQNNTFEKQRGVEDLHVAISRAEPSDELLSCDRNAEAEPVIEPLHTSSEQGTLCGECKTRAKAQLKYDVPCRLFELCDINAMNETFDLEYDESKAGESVVKGASLDECSEEEYADCIDGKSQGSVETDESFKSFIDEPEELYPVQNDDDDDDKPVHDDLETDECCPGCTQESHDVSGDTPDPYTPDGLEAHENTQESSETSGKKMYKTYAEVLCAGLCKAVQSPKPCLEPPKPTDEEDYGPKLNNDDTIAHDVEDQDFKVLFQDENVVESHEEVIVPDPSENAGETYGPPTVDEGISKSETSDPDSVQSTRQEQVLAALERDAEHDFVAENEVSEKFTEVSRPIEKEVKHDHVSEIEPDKCESANLTPDAQMKAEDESEVLDETRHGHGEPETREHVDTFIFASEKDVADVEKCNELNASEDPQNGANDLVIVQNAIELQSGKDPCKDPEPPGSGSTSLDLTEQKDGSLPRSKCSKKLNEIIHQVVQSKTTEHSEPDDFFTLADENATSEQIEVYEDTEASDDEDYPEFCDCEFCVQSIEQVQCFSSPCKRKGSARLALGVLTDFKA